MEEKAGCLHRWDTDVSIPFPPPNFPKLLCRVGILEFTPSVNFPQDVISFQWFWPILSSFNRYTETCKRLSFDTSWGDTVPCRTTQHSWDSKEPFKQIAWTGVQSESKGLVPMKRSWQRRAVVQEHAQWSPRNRESAITSNPVQWLWLRGRWTNHGLISSCLEQRKSIATS